MSPFNPGTGGPWWVGGPVGWWDGGLVVQWELVGNWWIEKGSKND